MSTKTKQLDDQNEGKSENKYGLSSKEHILVTAKIHDIIGCNMLSIKTRQSYNKY